MALLYTLTIKKLPEKTSVEDFPPQVIESSWYETFDARSFSFSGDTSKKTIIRAMYFIDSAAAESWFSAGRLTDPELISIFNEWKTTHSIVYEEHWHELPEYSAGIAGLFV